MSTPWWHSFSVTDTQLYQGKFTIYRITSVVFPVGQPGALTCVTSWKRYKDVKELHRKLSKQLKNERLGLKLPPLERNVSYFQRFHPKVIEDRRQWILELLQCISSEPSLYSGDTFTKFLQTGYMPPGPQADTVDGECLSPSDASEDQSSGSLGEDPEIPTSQRTKSSHPPSHGDIQIRFSSDYMVEACERFNEAVQFEVNDRYVQALTSYREGIEVLLAGIRSEGDADRVRVAQEKANKYVDRCNNIYEHFLKTPAANESQEANNNKGTMTDFVGSRVGSRELPPGELAKYKVVRILDDNVMYVQEITTRRFFVIKSIDRTEDWHMGLVASAPEYMVSLVAYFMTEFVVFLLLKPASGGRLVDYIASYDSDDGFDIGSDRKEENQIQPPSIELDVEELLLSSQRLLISVQRTLDGTNSADLTDAKESGDGKDAASQEPRLPKPCPEECVRQWTKELIVAVDALHRNNIILGHLSTRNLLLGKSGQLLLTYYYYWNYSNAISKHSFEGDGREAFDRQAGIPTDWFCVGVVLYELLTGQSYWENHSSRWCYFELQLPENVGVSLTKDAISLLQGLLTEDPDSRLKFADICAHSFFAAAH